ncbi:ATP-binding protein [Dyadobacter psychrophilus]|uniref:ATPase family associated with various cellular activities (AAA) n=1 Tax=Dyadobacter psychrophilus TaxID=651661 RepID=A0A1T5DKM6_9BACT|nr:ATP-binding protein [Dyadobacter psychrophilus]SKB72235.1 ATPase family associated with various cellular activities (AAA) [Dyadobacter psychrophilus]
MVNNAKHMEMEPLEAVNAQCLRTELQWFVAVANERLSVTFPNPPAPSEKDSKQEPPRDKGWLGKLFSDEQEAAQYGDIKLLTTSSATPPDLTQSVATYAELVRHYSMSTEERLVLMLALIPHIQPQLLDIFFAPNKINNRGFSEFGGIKGQQFGGFLPTIETALYIAAGNDLERRFRLAHIFEPDHFFFLHNILYIHTQPGNEPYTSGQICLTDEYTDFFTTGKQRTPQFSMDFPAKRLQTQMEWEDLVLEEVTAKQLDEIRIWLQHRETLMNDWGMAKKLKPGYKALFYGPPGTGKTLTASLLGKLFKRDVYRVDLSMVISKYIGETEKNLEKVFKRAENKNWILFFDEADALFGKRTTISDSHDKYANQEIAYLLQRLEDYPSLVILGTNMRYNIEEAFMRRLQVVVHFPKPQSKERQRLWQSSFSAKAQFAEDVNFEQIARQYELSGGSIVNVVQYASLLALSRGGNVISQSDIIQGIRKEYLKEGKTI